jgi:integrase
MARSIYSEKLKNRTNRLKLPAKRKPYKVLIAPGIFLCYRRNAGRLVEGDERQRKQAPGTWSVEAGWLKRFALADDHEDANGVSVMSYFQAQQRALKLARGSEGDSDKPVTVAEALDAYETDLAARGGSKHNAISVRNHCSPAMLSKVVMLLTETELRDWRNGLIAKGLKLSSANRIGKSFKAALALAAKRDRKRIGNTAAWRDGLKPLKGKGNTLPPRDNYYRPDGTIRAIVRECYVEDADFGALVDVLAGTGVRESQALKLMPDDILDDDSEAPRLMMWCSNKGAADRDPEQRALPITPKLAQMLRARAMARPRRPLFDRIWNLSKRFRVVLERLDLDPTLTPYVLRHSSIIRQIRSGTALRLISFAHDTSTEEIERTYARYLNVASDDARKGLLADDAPPVDNVIKLAR